MTMTFMKKMMKMYYCPRKKIMMMMIMMMISMSLRGSRGSSTAQQTPGETLSPSPTSSSRINLNQMTLQNRGNNAACSSSTQVAGSSSTQVSSTGQTQLRLTSTGALVPHGVVPKVCTRTFKKVKNPTGYNWKSTPNDVKQIYWEEFKKMFTWDPSIESDVQQKWKDKAARRYMEFVNKVKTKKEPPGHNPPPYIDEDVWQNWLKYWDLEDVKTKSNTARRCRMSEPAGPGTGIVKYKGGSKSALQYTEELREVQERAQQLSQPLPGTTEPQEVDLNEFYMDVVGISSKNTIFGGGKLRR